MTRHITVGKDEGMFSHDVLVTNGSPAAFRVCDLTVTVQFAGGKRTPVPVVWPVWAAGERRTVTVPAGGRIERVEVAGTMADAATGETGRVDASVDWKPAGK